MPRVRLAVESDVYVFTLDMSVGLSIRDSFVVYPGHGLWITRLQASALGVKRQAQVAFGK